jgi:hypothetical protein
METTEKVVYWLLQGQRDGLVFAAVNYVAVSASWCLQGNERLWWSWWHDEIEPVAVRGGPQALPACKTRRCKPVYQIWWAATYLAPLQRRIALLHHLVPQVHHRRAADIALCAV